MSVSTPPRRPRAIALPASGDVPESPEWTLDDTLDQVVPIPELVTQPSLKRRFGWGSLFVSAMGGLVSIALALWLDGFIRAAWAAYPGLGPVVAGLSALAGLALGVIVVRETAAIWRLARIETLRETAILALARDDSDAAAAVAVDLVALYRDRPETAAARGAIADLAGDILDAADRLALAERALLGPIDAIVARRIAEASQRVSLVTAISPRALVDVAFVAAQSILLLRAISAAYGGRPGFFGFLRVGRAALSHLALTGGMAAADSVVQQLVGQGLAARLSAKLGEGVLNGLLTARVGLAAMAACRPLPFIVLAPPGLKDVAGKLITRGD